MSKHVLLVEPEYYTRYPPLGLLKISAYHKRIGDTVELVRGCIRPLKRPDLIYVTSLFTWAWRPVHEAVRYFKILFPDVQVLLGGVYASLIPGHARLSGADQIFSGLFDGAENLMPDYTLVPEWDGSIIFASRGCIRKCGFCSVPKLEGSPSGLKYSIRPYIYPKHTRAIFYDNNILGSSNCHSIFDEVIELGLRVDFNQGLDVRLIDDRAAEKLAKMKFFPMIRLAYDYIGIGKYVRNAIEKLAQHGVNRRKIMVYILFNYIDSPEDFLARIRDVANWGAVAYPMKYQPLCAIEKEGFIAPKWNYERLQLVQRARRVIGYGGAFPPYEGLLVKLNNATTFEKAFELEPIKNSDRKCGDILMKKELRSVEEEHADPSRNYFPAWRREKNWRLTPQALETGS